MPAFTAYIDRNTNRKVTVIAATAAHARQYATSRYGKVEKIKLAPNMEPPPPGARDASRLRDLQNGIGLRRDNIRRLRALGLIDEVNGLTPAGCAFLANQDRESPDV